MNSDATRTRRHTSFLLVLVAAAGAAVGLTLALATDGGDEPGKSTLPYDNPGPPGPTVPSFGANNPRSVPKALYREGLGNVHYDSSYLAFLLARTAGDDDEVCAAGCGIAAEPANLTIWFESACQRLEDSSVFTEESFASEMTPAAENLVGVGRDTCGEVAQMARTAGPPNPASPEWSEFASSRRASLVDAIRAVDPEVQPK